MTGFYLCLLYISIFSVIFYPKSLNLLISLNDNFVYSDDMAILPHSHFGNLDSVCTKYHLAQAYPIQTLISTRRTYAKPITKSNYNRAACLKEVSVSNFIPTLITARKPSNNNKNQLGHFESDKGRLILSLEDKLDRNHNTFASDKGPKIWRPEKRYNSRPKNGRAVPTNLIPIPREKTISPQDKAPLPNIYLHNMRSLNDEKFNELKLIAPRYDIIMLTESWLKSDKENLYNINGFTMHVCNRAGKRTGGGVAVYVKNHLPIQKLSELKTTNVSALWFMYKQPGYHPITFSLIYHPPGLKKSLKDNTIEHIITTTSKHLKSYPDTKLFICGDFNDLDTTDITTLLPVSQIVDFPTRADAKLDMIFTDLDEYVSSGCVQLPPILCNDHCAIVVPSSLRVKLPNYVTIEKRGIPPENKIKISEELSITRLVGCKIMRFSPYTGRDVPADDKIDI